MTDLTGWLDARRPPPPPSLRAALDDALADGDPGQGPVSHRLAAAGLAGLEGVVRGPGSRAAALPLLAADALLTYACEAAIEEEARGDNDAVARLAERLGHGAFERVLQRGTDS